jgi:hypothetical protein
MRKICPARRDTYEEADAYETADAQEAASSSWHLCYTQPTVSICRM